LQMQITLPLRPYLMSIATILITSSSSHLSSRCARTVYSSILSDYTSPSHHWKHHRPPQVTHVILNPQPRAGNIIKDSVISVSTVYPILSIRLVRLIRGRFRSISRGDLACVEVG